MKRAVKVITVGMLVLLACWVIGYQFEYSYDLNMVTLPVEIGKMYNKGYEREKLPYVNVHDGVGVGNREYYLFEIGEEMQLGTVTLEKGWNGRWKIEWIRYGDGNFRNSIVEENGHSYLIFAGRDMSRKIAAVQVTVQNREYTLQVMGHDENFIMCEEVYLTEKEYHVSPDAVRFLDIDGNDITEQYDRSGGGI